MSVAQQTVMQPLGDNLVIAREKTPEMTRGGIALPQKSQMQEARGQVIAAGPGRLSEKGERLRRTVCRVGDVVIFRAHAAHMIEVEGEVYAVVSEEDVLLRLDAGD